MPKTAEKTQQFHDWRGSAYEIGVQHGQTLKQAIIGECQPALDKAVAAFGGDQAAFLKKYVEQYEPMFREHSPRAIDEIKGMADGSGLGWQYTFFAATRDGAKLSNIYSDDCTAFHCGANTTTDGHVLLGQTKDTDAPLHRYHIMRRTYDDGLMLLTLNYPGWLTHVGMNSHGVACTGNSLYAKAAEIDTVPFTLMRYLIAEARDTDSIAKRVDALPLENGCMMVADVTGQAFCLESVAGKRNCRDITSQAFGHANSVLSPQLLPDQDAQLMSPSSPCRQRNMQRLLDERRGQLNVETMKTILSDHTDHPRSVCLHNSEGDPIVTTAAIICDCTAKSVAIAIGQPCCNPFQNYVFSL